MPDGSRPPNGAVVETAAGFYMMSNGSGVKVTPTSVTTSDGSKVTGYNAGGTTYMLGGSRPTMGSTVHTSDGDYLMTASGGVKVGSGFGPKLSSASGGTSYSGYEMIADLPTNNSNGYLTIGVKIPIICAGFSVLIDLDTAEPGLVFSGGAIAGVSANWTPGEPQSGYSTFAEQYVGVGVTANSSGQHSIGIGLGGGFGKSYTILFDSPTKPQKYR